MMRFGPIKVFLSHCHNVAYRSDYRWRGVCKVPFVGRRSFLPDIANINEDMRLKEENNHQPAGAQEKERRLLPLQLSTMRIQ